MAGYIQGTYKPKNMAKYVGESLPRYRSSWELKTFQWLDEHQGVVSWASEPLEIPYKHPLTGRVHKYIPDLLVKYVDRHGKTHVELLEIKPASQSLMENAKKNKDKMAVAVNTEKWKYAQHWCNIHNIGFRVITEHDIFFGAKKPSNKPKMTRKK